MGTLHEDQYTFLIVSCWVLHRMRNVLDKNCRGNQNTHFVFNNFFFFFFENRAVHEIMWKYVVKSGGRPQMTVWLMCIACWITKATRTHAHTLTICKTYCFSTVSVTERIRLNVTLYVQCLSCCLCLPY